LSLILLVT